MRQAILVKKLERTCLSTVRNFSEEKGGKEG